MIILQTPENELHNSFNPTRNLDFLNNNNNPSSIGNFTQNTPQNFPSQMYQATATTSQYQSQPSFVYGNSHLSYPSNTTTTGQNNSRPTTTLSRQSNPSASNNQSISNSSPTSDPNFVPTTSAAIDSNGYHPTTAHLGYRYDPSTAAAVAVVAAVSTATNTAASSACSSPSIATTTLTSTASPSPNSSSMNHQDFSKSSPILMNNQASPINNHSVVSSATASNPMQTENGSNVLPPLSQVFPTQSSSNNNNIMTNSTSNPTSGSSTINNPNNASPQQLVANIQQQQQHHHHHNNNHHHNQHHQQTTTIHNHNHHHNNNNLHQSSHPSNATTTAATNAATTSSNIQLSTAAAAAAQANFLQSIQQQYSDVNTANYAAAAQAQDGVTYAPQLISQAAALNYQQQQAAAAAAAAQHQALLHNHFMAAAHSLTNGSLIATANTQRTSTASQSPNSRRGIINNNGMIVGGSGMDNGCGGSNVDINSQSHDHQHGQQQQQQQQRPQKVYSFVALPGINTKKRPRRRYDEIERHYACNFPGCTKSYGTLNHLNAHVQMQKHGPKRHPSEFKELRKQWRRQKREEEERKAAEAAAAKNLTNLNNMSI